MHEYHFREQLERRINKWAEEISPQYRIKKGTFRIFIQPNKRSPYYQPVARVTNGAVVRITLTYPMVDKSENIKDLTRQTVKHLKRTTRRIFRYISNPNLHRDEDLFNPLIKSDTTHEYVHGVGSLVWKRIRHDNEKMHGHKKKEFDIEIRRTTMVSFKHRQTGITYIVKDNSPNRLEYDIVEECWKKCAMLVEIYLENKEKREPSTALVPVSLYNHLRRITNEHIR